MVSTHYRIRESSGSFVTKCLNILCGPTQENKVLNAKIELNCVDLKRSWLKHYTAIWRVSGLIPDEVIGFSLFT
jgi:hypothetical protein